MITFGSLFAGIGGIDLGLERCGMRCKWQVEIDDYARKVLAKHWPDVKRHDDIRTWPTEDAERVDLIAGGFPCQDISFAGKGEGIHGKRSGLFFELIRVVREMEPRYVLLENVSAILAPGRGMGEVLGSLAEIGFDAEWHCVPAAYVGAPHIRDRVFILAYAGSDCGRARGKGRLARTTSRLHLPMQPKSSNEAATGIGHWATEPGVGRMVHGISPAVDRLRGLGNAVVPQVAEYVGRMILESEKLLIAERSEL